MRIYKPRPGRVKKIDDEWRLTILLGDQRDRTEMKKRAKYLDKDVGTLVRTLVKAFLSGDIVIHYELNGKAILFEEEDDDYGY